MPPELARKKKDPMPPRIARVDDDSSSDSNSAYNSIYRSSQHSITLTKSSSDGFMDDAN